MLNRIKKNLFDWYLSRISEKWGTTRGYRVLIQTNHFFNQSSWESLIKNFSPDKHNEVFNIQFVRKKKDIIKNFNKADAAFLFGFSKYLPIKENQKKLLYFPVIGKEFLNSISIPEGYSVKQPLGIASSAIAEYCLIMSVNYYRNFKNSFYGQKIRNWNQYPLIKNEYISIKDKKIGVVGVGNVGRKIAAVFKNYGCTVYGLDKNIDNKNDSIAKWFTSNQLVSLFSETDIIIISLPLNDSTKNLITKKELDILSNTKLLINISRGEIVNEHDLYNALYSKKLGGAIVDTFSQEPLKKNHQFYRLDNIIITPHIAGNINLFVKEIQTDFLNQLLHYFNK
jgi:phosphoglycerate dehydrogenase-like enzyme